MSNIFRLVYSAGWNMPGYLPDTEPVLFDRFEDAANYLADTIDSFWSEEVWTYDAKSLEENPPDQKWASIYREILSIVEEDRNDWYRLNGDNSLSFWITAIDDRTGM